MKRVFTAATIYCLALFALGFVLGTMRVLFVAARLGVLGATLLELPMMLGSAFFLCRWVVRRWQVPRALTARWAMALCFLVLLFGLEMLLGVTLFGRTAAQQWTALTASAGLLGLTAQIIAALLPLFVGRTKP